MNPLQRAAVRHPDQPRILPLYERALAACRRHDAREAVESLVELILALDFQYEQAAGELFGLYDLCLRRVKSGRFDVARQILGELQAAWTAPTARP